MNTDECPSLCDPWSADWRLEICATPVRRFEVAFWDPRINIGFVNPSKAYCFLFLFLLTEKTPALEPEAGAVFARVVDVGAGLCCVVKMPGNHYMLYDAGNGHSAEAKIRELIPTNSTIDLMVLSHSDTDHLGAVPFVCKNYAVKRVIYSGLPKPASLTSSTPTSAWREAVKAIKKEVASDGCDEFSLATRDLTPGKTYQMEDVKVTMVFGLHEPPPEWDFSPKRHSSEYWNSGSIVARLEFKGRSILFCGDSVGRLIGDAKTNCIAAEHAMVLHDGTVPLRSDIIIAPHHGADNGSSLDFIQHVKPTFVVFSAGARFGHPRAATAKRYLDEGVSLTKMFRTDLGDKRRKGEWDQGNNSHGHANGKGDVDILIDKNGKETVAYRNL